MNTKGFIIGISLFSLIFGGCHKSDKKGVEMPPLEVDVAEVQTDSVMIYKEYPGRLRAASVVDIVGRVDGTLLSKSFTGGDIVKKGQLLFTIEDTQYRNAVEQARGQLENALSSNGYASKQYEAMKKAIQSDAVSEMELLQAKSTYEEGLATIKTAQANLQTAQTNLGYCRVTAPFTGRITDSTIQPGAYVGGSVSPVVLATLYDNSTFYAEFFVEDNTFMHIAGSNSSSVKSGYKDIPLKFQEPLKHEYKGTFNYIAPDVDAGTGTMKMNAEIQNDYDELRDGMYVTISLPYQNAPHAILIDDAAIGTDQSGKYVYVVNDNNEVVYTPIKIGELASDNRRVIISGLTPGQKYVTKALLKVKNGSKVKPILSNTLTQNPK